MRKRLSSLYITNKSLTNIKFDNEIENFIAIISQMQNRQELFVDQKKRRIERLVKLIKIQNIEASNAIVGIRPLKTTSEE